jgi:hypothetical protein
VSTLKVKEIMQPYFGRLLILNISSEISSSKFSKEKTAIAHTMAKKVLILVFSNLKKDARVARQIDFLKSEYKVTVACFDADPDGFAFIPLQQIKLSFYRKLTVGLFLIVQQF